MNRNEDIYHRVTILKETKASVARLYGISSQRVDQIIKRTTRQRIEVALEDTFGFDNFKRNKRKRVKGLLID